MQRIIMVEDDESIREAVLYALKASGFEAVGYEDAEGFYADVFGDCREAALVILDVMLPGDDGLTILKKIRNSAGAMRLPVIMLTARGSEFDRVKGLDLGADDYIVKPFSVMELISRVNAVLRRTAPESTSSSASGGAEVGVEVGASEGASGAGAGADAAVRNPAGMAGAADTAVGAANAAIAPAYTERNILVYENLRLDHSKRIVTADAKNVALTFKEYELLHYMLMNRGLALGRDRIIEAVWGYDFEGESRTLDMHIRSLRQKLGPAGNYIATIRNFGYRLGE